MILEQWWPYYSDICQQFSFDPRLDYLSSLKLSGILGTRSDSSRLDFIRGRDVNIYGNSSSLVEYLDYAPRGISIVADSALETYLQRRGCPEIIVSDLDGNMEKILECGESGTILVLHSHGDNIESVQSLDTSRIWNVVGTTQNMPLWNVFNYGGFTDGDRAAFIADSIGSGMINLIGFDFNSVNTQKKSDPSTKLQKLKWAKRLLTNLAEKRGSVISEGGIIRI